MEPRAGLRRSPSRRGRDGIYVLSGTPIFVFLDGDVERRIEAGPGDYVYVPP